MSKPTVVVWSVCVGDKYTDEDVLILRHMVMRQYFDCDSRHFMCLSDRQIPGVMCVPTAVDWPGWWQKLYLFHLTRNTAPGTINIYFDLDVVITGSIEPLFSEQLSMPANWAQSGHGGCQSSVMSWGGDYSHIPDRFNPIHLAKPERGNCGMYLGAAKELWGDQEFITEIMGCPGEGKIAPMGHVVSYKYHCRKGLPEDASVVCFHGEPKPNQVNDEWVLEARSYTPTAA